MEKLINIVDHYSQYFAMVNAVTAQQRKISYQLRHQVFHQDCGYRDLGSLSSKQYEHDEFDENAIHSLLFHKQSGQAIGYIRLVLAKSKSKQTLPHEKLYTREYDFSHSSINSIAKDRCEISRMALISAFRRRKNERLMQQDQRNNEKQDGNRRFPVNYLPICLIFAVMHSMREEKMDYGLAFVEKRIPLFLKHYGAQIDAIGEPVECYGIRAPVILHLEATYQKLKPEYQQLFDFISWELKSDTKGYF